VNAVIPAAANVGLTCGGVDVLSVVNGGCKQ
jgi:hypothetical protein